MELQINKVYRLKRPQVALKIGELLTYKGNDEFHCIDGLSVYLKPEMVDEIKPISKEARRATCDAILDRCMTNDTLFYNLVNLANDCK